jgi:hypothetical protein
MKKSHIMPVWLSKCSFFVLAGKWPSNGVHLHCNKYDLSAGQCFDWPIIMIGPAGLLLVAPHLFVVPVSVLWVGLQINK